jgi:hypothetical protein
MKKNPSGDFDESQKGEFQWLFDCFPVVNRALFHKYPIKIQAYSK